MGYDDSFLAYVRLELFTVKPPYSGHPSDFSKVSTIERLGLSKSKVFTKSRRVF
jgi:hypothetical protein